ncbi:MAG: type IV pilin [Methanolinea sp.]
MKIIKNDEAVSPVKTVTTEDAVSPVIGVILMVAITVILAAVIAAFVFGMAGTSTTTKTVGMGVALDTDERAVITINGGADLPSMNNMTYRLNGTATTNGFEYNNANTWTTLTSDQFPLKVGQQVRTPGSVSGSKIAIIALFKDGSEQVMMERQF